MLELSAENISRSGYYYAELELPAKEYEIRDALQKVRGIGGNNAQIEVSLYNCDLLPELSEVRLDSPTIDELNFFAKRLSKLGEDEQYVFKAVSSRVLKDDIVSMKDLINLTYGLDNVSVISNVSSDEELADFVIENEIQGDVAKVPKDAIYLLDKKQIGRMQRASDCGVFVGNRYVVTCDYEIPQVYDGKTLPEAEVEQWYAFRILAAKPRVSEENAIWINLPIDKTNANEIAKSLGVDCIEDCIYYDFESTMPQITDETFDSMQDFDNLNNLAFAMIEMSPNEQVKLKAVLTAEKPNSISEVLSLTENLNKYEFSAVADTDDDFFKEYLKHHLDERFDKEWLNTLLVRTEGARIIDRLSATVTAYGTVSAQGRSLFELVPYHKTNMEEAITEKPDEDFDTKLEFGGMNL